MPLIRQATEWVSAVPDNLRRVIPSRHSARIVEATLSLFVVVRIPYFGSVPTAQLAIIGLVGLAVFRRPTRSLGLARWFPWLAALLVGYGILETLASGIDPTRRAINVSVLLVAAGFMASGRIDVGSVIKGVWAGLLLNALLFYTHVAPDDYHGRLTGFLQDPNAGGLVVGCIAILFSMTVQKRWARALVLILGAAMLFGTGSRTSTAAYVCAVVWLCLTHRLGRGLQITLGALVASAFIWASNTIASNVEILSDRTGSDALRARIDSASTEKVLAAPWHGYGLAQGTVHIDGSTWFFNSSYQDLIAEGGFILAAGVLACYVLAGFGMRARAKVIEVQAWESRAIAAATLVVFFCGSRLGEVFFSVTGLIVLGVGLARLAVVSQPDNEVVADQVPPWYRFSLQAEPHRPPLASRGIVR